MSDDSIRITVSSIAVLCGMILYAVNTEHARQPLAHMMTPPAVEAISDAARPTEPAAYAGPYFNAPPRHARTHQRPVHLHEEEAAKSRR